MMMLSILFFIIPLLSQNQVFSSTVLLWSNSNLPDSTLPLSSLSPVDIISNSICKLPSEQIELRLFAVNGLTNEDIQRGSQSEHSIIIDAKNGKSQYRYFPNVADDVYKAFSLISQSNNMQCSHIHFQTTSTGVFETLHDALNAMKVSMDSIEKDSDTVIVMALTTGPIATQNSIRQRRDTEVYNEDVLVSDDESSCMFYADKLYLFNGNGKKSGGNYSLNYDRSSCKYNTTTTKNQNTTFAILDLFWDNEINDTVQTILTTSLGDRYWYLDSAVINETTYRYFAYGMYSTMDTPARFSYVCTTATFVAYDGSGRGTYNFEDKFSITNLQLQPFNGNGSYFGPPNYCTSFFTSGIWMGLTSSLLCLGILLFGVYRMMSIKSNDRFDDPKGKPLIIKAQE